MAKWDTNVLVSFGTTFMPPVDTMQKILDMTQLTEMKNTGFIISLKEHNPVFDVITNLNPKNVMLRSFVPQREILASENLNLFLGHCGSNGILESLYFGKVMIGFAQVDEQVAFCTRMKAIQVVRTPERTISPQNLASLISEVADKSAPE